MKKIVFIGVLISFLAGCHSVPLTVPTVMEKQYDVLGEGEGSADHAFNVIPIGQKSAL
jgi:hypothetical protein